MGRRIVLIATASMMLFVLVNAAKKNNDDSGKLLSDWIKVHLKLVRTTKGIPHVGYSRHFSYTAIAFYEAVIPGEKKYRSLAGQLQELDKLPVYSSKNQFVSRASANAAYAAMLRNFYGKNPNASVIDSMETANHESLLRSGISKEGITASANFGKSIASDIIRWSEKDGCEKVIADFKPAVGEGLWEPTFPKFTPANVPHWQNNRTMVKGSTNNVITSMPPAYATDPNSAYQKMVMEVFDISQSLSQEQKNIALFWDDSPGGFLTVPGHWSSILAQVIEARKYSLPLSAEAFAKMQIAFNDACIAAWTGKYKYNLARPIANIRKSIKSDWVPLIETPPHPEFPAAHATLSSAAATGLADALGNNISFTDNTYGEWGMKARSFNSFEEAAREAGISRLYGGIHYRFSIEEGLKVGKRTAETVLKKLKFH